jgi:LPXTG-motif cell wall-anchored protein
VEGVKPGPHKLVLIARNPASDAVFDRREINFVATGSGSTRGVSAVTENAVGAHVPPAVSSTERKQSYTATDSTQTAGSEMPAAATSSRSSASSTYSSERSPANPSATGDSGRTSAMTTQPAAPPSTDASSETRSTSGGADEPLPKTASSDALLVLAGAGLLATGILLRRSA